MAGGRGAAWAGATGRRGGPRARRGAAGEGRRLGQVRSGSRAERTNLLPGRRGRAVHAIIDTLTGLQATCRPCGWPLRPPFCGPGPAAPAAARAAPAGGPGPPCSPGLSPCQDRLYVRDCELLAARQRCPPRGLYRLSANDSRLFETVHTWMCTRCTHISCPTISRVLNCSLVGLQARSCLCRCAMCAAEA